MISPIFLIFNNKVQIKQTPIQQQQRNNHSRLHRLHRATYTGNIDPPYTIPTWEEFNPRPTICHVYSKLMSCRTCVSVGGFEIRSLSQKARVPRLWGASFRRYRCVPRLSYRNLTYSLLFWCYSIFLLFMETLILMWFCNVFISQSPTNFFLFLFV